jgi:hypothetical protein
MDAAVYTLAGSLGGVLLGFGGQYWLALRGEDAARRARLGDHRRPVYDGLVRACRKQLTLIEHLHPILEVLPPPELPDDMTHDEATEVQAQADTWSSPEVAAAHLNFGKAIRVFEGVVRSERQEELSRSGKRDSIGQGEPYIRVEEARETVRERYRDLVKIIRSEMEEIV